MKRNDHLPARVDSAPPPMLKVEGQAGSFLVKRREVKIPAELCYVIAKPRFDSQGRLLQSGKGGLVSSAFDILAREAAFKWSPIDIIEDSEFCVKIGVSAEYLNSTGKLVRDSEIYEIDVKALYDHARANWQDIIWNRSKVEDPEFETVEERTGYNKQKKKVVVRKPIADLSYDEDGEPIIKYRLPKEAEISIHQNVMLHLKKFKVAKGITCAKRRIVQRAFGLKGLNIDNPDWEKNVKVEVYNFIKVADEASEKPTLELVDDLNEPEMIDAAQFDESDIEPEPEPPPKKTKARPKAASIVNPRGKRQKELAEEPEPEPESEDAPEPESSGDPVLIIVGGNNYSYITALKETLGMSWGPKKGYKLGKVWVKECVDHREAEILCNKILELPDNQDNSKTIYETNDLHLFSMGPGDKKPMPINVQE
jgi:hypothetical protein